MRRLEDFCARNWRCMIMGAVVVAAVGCALSEVQDGTIVDKPGIDLIPGSTLDNDITGAIVDAVSKVDVPADGNLVGLGVTIAGFISAVLGGVVVRRKIRARKAKKAKVA